ncbi:unnamed protein product [Trichobilharzia szidati]|nr:unnamed protein product [Trichobilharzia szidati]
MDPTVDMNDGDKESLSENPDLSQDANVPSTTTTAETTITTVENDQPNDTDTTVDQPFKKPKLTTESDLDSPCSKPGTPNLSNIIPVITDSAVASSSSLSSEAVTSYVDPLVVTECPETVASVIGIDDPTTTVLLVSEAAEDEGEDDEEEEEDIDDEDEEDDIDDEDDNTTVLGDADTESVVSEIISPVLQQDKEARKIEDRKLLALLAHFDEEQLNRFETFRRATFAKAAVRRLVQSVTSSSVSQNVVIAMAGLTKVFIGELVEEALSYKERLGESGPLKPKHIREAYRVLSEEGRCCTETPENPLL